jgi:multidrug efflux pump subunit AcrA (membrane-fusion protein)
MIKKLVAVMMISVILIGGCDKKDIAVPTLKEAAGGKMDTAVVTRGDIYKLTTYDAKIYPNIEEVYSAIDGKVKEVSVYLGQEVKAGDILMKLDDTKIKEQLTQLQKQLEDARINNKYDKMQQEFDIRIMELNLKQKIEENASEIDIALMKADLEKLKLINQQTLDLNSYYLEKMQKKMNALKKELDKTALKAPCSGNIVYMKELHLNGRVSVDEPVIIITDISKLHLQSDYIDISRIKNASQIYAVIKGKEYEIEYIPFEAEELLKMKNSGIVLDSRYSINADSNISSGDYGSIYIKDNFKTNVIIIPKNALYSDSSGNFVYRIIDNNLERCNVEIGKETDIQVEIISGLTEGDVVYVQK